MIGFIILRHVKCQKTNLYWIEAYTCLRKFYPENKIVIIDDNSNYDFITDFVLENTTIINSEYKGRGELLPYIYYLRNPLFEKAVIIHDSVFFQRQVDFNQENMPLWSFNKLVQYRDIELKLIESLDNMQPLRDIYNGDWIGCFGGMSVITHEFLINVNNKYNLEKLIENVTCRNDRMCLERILGLIFTSEKQDRSSVFGVIFDYVRWGYTYSEYEFDKKNNTLGINNLPVIKVWTGR